MKLDDMLIPGAAIPVDPDHIHKLVQEVRRLRSASDLEALSFYAFTAALVQKAGGTVELTAAEQDQAKILQMEVADKADGTTVVRILSKEPSAIIEHRPTIALPH